MHGEGISHKRGVFYSYNTKTGCFFRYIHDNAHVQILINKLWIFQELCFEHVLLEKKNRGGNKDANYGKTLQFRWKSDTADDLGSSLENVKALNGV